jgi:hypothetical protein
MAGDYLLLAIPFACVLVGLVFWVVAGGSHGGRPWRH